MKALTKIENLIFRIGALLMVAGAATWIVGGWISNAIFVVGVVMFVTMQLRASYEGNDFVVVRLRRQQLFGAAALVVSAVAMTAQTLGYNLLQHNEWVVCMLIGAVLQLYTAIRIPQALKLSLFLLFPMSFLVGCSDHYMVNGSTSVHGMEGKMLYMKVFENQKLKDIDSCCVTHGKFSFKGYSDSTMMVNLFWGNQSLMPVVLEGEKIEMKIDEVAQIATGGPLNDSLYSFIKRKTQIDNQMADLPRKEGRMVMDGMEHDEVMTRLSDEARRLSIESDQLVSGFIKQNYNNVLGPGVFMIMTSEFAYPVLTPQIEELIIGAPSYFLEHPYIKEYLRVARENMDKLQQQ